MFKRIVTTIATIALVLGFVATGSASANPANTGQLKITVMGYNAKGIDNSFNRNEEYVKMVAQSDIDVTGWTLSDSVGNETNQIGRAHV